MSSLVPVRTMTSRLKKVWLELLTEINKELSFPLQRYLYLGEAGLSHLLGQRLGKPRTKRSPHAKVARPSAHADRCPALKSAPRIYS